MNSLFAVVVNWNLKNETLACVDSLFRAGIKSGQVIVVDNGSVDNSKQALQDRFGSTIHLITSEQNLGFAGGCNLGIKYALERQVEWVLVLNNDTRVAPSFLAALADAAASDNRFSILGPIIFFDDAPDKIWYSGDRLLPGLLATRHVHRGQTKPPDRMVSVDFLSGCCMLIKREVFEKIGLFDKSFFMYGEDVDFCWRARTAGFQLAVATNAMMWHKVSQSSNHDAAESWYFRIRNQNRFYRKYARGFQLVLMLVFSWLRVIGMAFGNLMHGRLSLIKPLAKGWVHGWFR